MKNYYEILQVSENASPEIIEKAYKVLAKKYHPDSYNSDKAYLAENAFKEIVEAYDVLSDKVLREQYDKQIGLISNTNNIKHSNYKQPTNYEQPINGKFYIKGLIKSITTAIHNQANKPKDERKRDFIALIITFFIVVILAFIVWNIPFLKNLLF